MRWRKTFVEIVTLSLLLAATQFCNGKTENLQSQTCNAAQMDCQVKSKSQFDQGGGGEAKEDEVTSEGTPSVGMGEVRGRLGNHLWGYLHVSQKTIPLYTQPKLLLSGKRKVARSQRMNTKFAPL